MPTRPKQTKRRPLFVHLGNVGERNPDETPAEKTKRYARRFPGIDFIGIDKKQLDLAQYPDQTLPNWKQELTDFQNGLKHQADNSLHAISSDIAFGHNYNLGTRFTQYHQELLRIAYKKLIPGGKLFAAVGDEIAQLNKYGAPTNHIKALKKVFQRSPFKNHFTIRPLTAAEAQRTYWAQVWTTQYRPVYQIIAEKPKQTNPEQQPRK